MLAWHGCDNLSLQSLMEPAVVDSNTAVFRGAYDIRVALPKTNVGMIVGSSRVDGLCRNNVISGHHHDQRNLGCVEIVRVESVKRAFLIEDMVKRPAQRERGVLVPHQWQLVESSKRPALHTHDILEQPKPGGSIADDVVTLVGVANHQGWLAVMARNGRVVGEQQAGIWPREPRKDQSGHQRHRKDAGEELHRRDEMSVVGLRMHIAVTGG